MHWYKKSMELVRLACSTNQGSLSIPPTRHSRRPMYGRLFPRTPEYYHWRRSYSTDGYPCLLWQYVCHPAMPASYYCSLHGTPLLLGSRACVPHPNDFHWTKAIILSAPNTEKIRLRMTSKYTWLTRSPGQIHHLIPHTFHADAEEVQNALIPAGT